VLLMGRVIESVRRDMASKQGQYTKESKRLQKNATHRER
jgi:hypothetical protein